MRCEKCVHHLNEEDVDLLDHEGQIFTQFEKEKELLKPNLLEGEEPVFCVWTYMVLGNKSVCANLEEDVDDE